MHIIIDKFKVGIIKRHFLQICNRITTRDWRQNLVFAQYLENEVQNLTKFCILMIINKIYFGIVTQHQFFKQSYAPEYIVVLW